MNVEPITINRTLQQVCLKARLRGSDSAACHRVFASPARVSDISGRKAAAFFQSPNKSNAGAMQRMVHQNLKSMEDVHFLNVYMKQRELSMQQGENNLEFFD